MTHPGVSPPTGTWHLNVDCDHPIWFVWGDVSAVPFTSHWKVQFDFVRIVSTEIVCISWCDYQPPCVCVRVFGLDDDWDTHLTHMVGCTISLAINRLVVLKILVGLCSWHEDEYVFLWSESKQILPSCCVSGGVSLKLKFGISEAPVSYPSVLYLHAFQNLTPVDAYSELMDRPRKIRNCERSVDW